MATTQTRPVYAEQEKQVRKRLQHRERMAQHRAAIKTLPPEDQHVINECARAARAKYRARHRSTLLEKERDRREAKSRENNNLDEFIRRRLARKAKAAKPLSQAIQLPLQPELDQLMEY